MYILLVLLSSFLVSTKSEYTAPLYAEWAHHHVVWINGKQQNQQKFLKMIDDYERNGIKVGGALIDSAWSTGFNNFEWDKSKFPNPEQIVKKLHAKGIKVILWVTSMINNDTNIYQTAKKEGYMLNNGKLAKWWHGHGGFLDYYNPKAVAWWHSLMDKVLDIGIDGFKCDGTDPITFLLKPWPYSNYAKRPLIYHDYGHKYYGDFYNYTKSKNPDGLIMARPTDTLKTYFSWNYSPKYVMFSGWVGDQDSSSDGLKKAMLNVVKSAWSGYLNFGFDIGGYRGQNISKNIFLRWVQVGALVPFMENGGNGKHQPWVFDQQTVDIYRKFVDLHYALKPNFLTSAAEKYKKKQSVITPLAAKIPQVTLKQPENYNYLLCDNLLVSPIFEENGQAEVIFPKGSKWVYYFNTSKVFNGGTRGFYTFPLNQTALFMKSNTVIPEQNTLIIVGLQRNMKITKNIMYGSYSDEIEVAYEGEKLSIKVDRYFKNQEIEKLQHLQYINIKLIGYETLQQGRITQSPNKIKMGINTKMYIEDIQLAKEYAIEQQKIKNNEDIQIQ